MECMNKCEVCGVEYEPKRKTSRYCGSKCKQACYRNRVSVTKPEVTVTGVTLSEPEPVTVTEHELSQEEIDSLPIGVSKPWSGQTTWTDTNYYEGVIINLIDLTLTELVDSNQWIPNWRRNMGEKYTTSTESSASC